MTALNTPSAIPRLALTLGEPAGIGVDICLQLIQQSLPAQLVAIGSPDLLEQRAKLLGLSLSLKAFDPYQEAQLHQPGELWIVPIELNKPCTPGILDENNSPYVLAMLRQAYQLCAMQQCQALVTAPVHKAILHQVEPTFKGHTEYFAQLAGIEQVLMSFFTSQLALGLVTTHCALQEVSTLLTAGRLENSIKLFHTGLTTLFKKSAPKIGICGLNPHAGEDGLLGKQEQAFMRPLIKNLQQQGLALEGPLPADTIFAPTQRQQYDGILAMYHDQGLAPFKALFFGEIVNVTLGLPFLRVSVDHGTALNLAGTGLASAQSLRKAVQLATQISS